MRRLLKRLVCVWRGHVFPSAEIYERIGISDVNFCTRCHKYWFDVFGR